MITDSQFCNCDMDLIDVSGLCNPSDTSQVINVNPYWKQMDVAETLQLPAQKPNIEQINAITITTDIVRTKVIVTPRSFNDTVTPPVAVPNLEGKRLTGRKLVIEGQLCQQIEYTADLIAQPVHSVHFYVPFSSYIVVPLEVTVNGTTMDSMDVTFDVNACVEDVIACVLDPRRIFKQVTMLLYATPTQTC